MWRTRIGRLHHCRVTGTPPARATSSTPCPPTSRAARPPPSSAVRRRSLSLSLSRGRATTASTVTLHHARVRHMPVSTIFASQARSRGAMTASTVIFHHTRVRHMTVRSLRHRRALVARESTVTLHHACVRHVTVRFCVTGALSWLVRRAHGLSEHCWRVVPRVRFLHACPVNGATVAVGSR